MLRKPTQTNKQGQPHVPSNLSENGFYNLKTIQADKRTARLLAKAITQAWNTPNTTTQVTLKTGTVVFMAMAESEYSTRFSGFTNQAEYKTFAANNVKEFSLVPYKRIYPKQRVRFHNGNSFERGVVVSAITLTKANRNKYPSAALRLGEQVFIIKQRDGRTFYGVPRWDVYGVEK